MGDQKLLQEAFDEFKKEQIRRKIDDLKDVFRKCVNSLHSIKAEKKAMEELFEKLGLVMTDELLDFLSKVEKYENLVFSVTSSGMVGIGTSSPEGPLMIYNMDTGDVDYKDK